MASGASLPGKGRRDCIPGPSPWLREINFSTKQMAQGVWLSGGPAGHLEGPGLSSTCIDWVSMGRADFRKNPSVVMSTPRNLF